MAQRGEPVYIFNAPAMRIRPGTQPLEKCDGEPQYVKCHSRP